MDLNKVLTELRQELNNLDAAILSLERLQLEGKRRGRPPKLLSEIKNNIKTQKGGGPGRTKPATGSPND